MNPKSPLSLDHQQLQKFQPNRYPFLLIDRVTECRPGAYAVGYKNFTNNEWFFPKHFPGNPNVPGVLQIEAMAQMLTVAITTLPNLEGSVTHALEHHVRFRKEVFPGDRLDIVANVNSWRRGVCKGRVTGHVGDNLVCDASMMITIPEILESFLPR
ncbi:3-hydroxyacyl-ACP dehydratase FabZ [Aquiluna sp.]|nr:3-hydroxyacyl-ACP dehydratase FabZ [Aquiluna sp.]